MSDQEGAGGEKPGGQKPQGQVSSVHIVNEHTDQLALRFPQHGDVISLVPPDSNSTSARAPTPSASDNRAGQATRNRQTGGTKARAKRAAKHHDQGPNSRRAARPIAGKVHNTRAQNQGAAPPRAAQPAPGQVDNTRTQDQKAAPPHVTHPDAQPAAESAAGQSDNTRAHDQAVVPPIYSDWAIGPSPAEMTEDDHMSWSLDEHALMRKAVEWLWSRIPDRTPRQVVNRMHLIYVEYGQQQYLTAPNGVVQTPIDKTPAAYDGRWYRPNFFLPLGNKDGEASGRARRSSIDDWYPAVQRLPKSDDGTQNKLQPDISSHNPHNAGDLPSTPTVGLKKVKQDVPAKRLEKVKQNVPAKRPKKVKQDVPAKRPKKVKQDVPAKRRLTLLLPAPKRRTEIKVFDSDEESDLSASLSSLYKSPRRLSPLPSVLKTTSDGGRGPVGYDPLPETRLMTSSPHEECKPGIPIRVCAFHVSYAKRPEKKPETSLNRPLLPNPKNQSLFYPLLNPTRASLWGPARDNLFGPARASFLGPEPLGQPQYPRPNQHPAPPVPLVKKEEIAPPIFLSAAPAPGNAKVLRTPFQAGYSPNTSQKKESTTLSSSGSEQQTSRSFNVPRNMPVDL